MYTSGEPAEGMPLFPLLICSIFNFRPADDDPKKLPSKNPLNLKRFSLTGLAGPIIM